MSTITVSKSFKVTIKGQEFELTTDEAKALHVALGAAICEKPLDPPTVPYQPKRNRRDDIAPGAFPPWTPPKRPWPIDEAPQWPRPREIMASDRHAVAVLGSGQRLLMHVSSKQ